MNDSSRTTTPPSGERLRRATFPRAFQGYDRDAVHAFLDEVAEWMDRSAVGGVPGTPNVRRELERVGEQTAGILTAAEEAATKLKAEATEYAKSLRQATDEETRRAKVETNRKAEQLIAEAEAKAGRIVDEAVARRRRLNQAITSLLERRDEIAEEAQRLADALLHAVDALRADRLEELQEATPVAADAEPADAEPADAELEPVAEAHPRDGEEEPAEDEEAPVEEIEGDLAAEEQPAQSPRTGRFAAEPTELVPADEPEPVVRRRPY